MCYIFAAAVMSLLFVNLWRNHCLFRLAGQPLQPKRTQKDLLISTGSAALAYVYLLTALTAQAVGYTHLGTHRGTYLIPAVVYALCLQPAADLMYQVVGEQSNEDMPFNTVRLLMVNRAHAQF